MTEDWGDWLMCALLIVCIVGLYAFQEAWHES